MRNEPRPHQRLSRPRRSASVHCVPAAAPASGPATDRPELPGVFPPQPCVHESLAPSWGHLNSGLAARSAIFTPRGLCQKGRRLWAARRARTCSRRRISSRLGSFDLRAIRRPEAARTISHADRSAAHTHQPVRPAGARPRRSISSRRSSLWRAHQDGRGCANVLTESRKRPRP